MTPTSITGAISEGDEKKKGARRERKREALTDCYRLERSVSAGTRVTVKSIRSVYNDEDGTQRHAKLEEFRWNKRKIGGKSGTCSLSTTAMGKKTKRRRESNEYYNSW